MSKGFIAAMTAILGLVVGGITLSCRKGNAYHNDERRDWKNAAVQAIQNQVEDPDYLKKRFEQVPKPMSEFESSEPKWLTEDTIVCRDGSWMAYRSQCHKEDPKAYDIFVAKASDGRWYYSDFHFCVGMISLISIGQPASLQEFQHLYFLREFDGASDVALEPTWIPKGEMRLPKEED